jgi:hypothetical protein
MRGRRLDLFFAVVFGLFFVGWLAFDKPTKVGLVDASTGWYANEVDPIFIDPPRWLETIGWFALVYGPAYAALAYAFYRGRDWWMPIILLPLAGMITATNVIYWVEELTGPLPPKNMPIFLALNAPYLVVPPLAALREIAIRSRRAPAGS